MECQNEIHNPDCQQRTCSELNTFGKFDYKCQNKARKVLFVFWVLSDFFIARIHMAILDNMKRDKLLLKRVDYLLVHTRAAKCSEAVLGNEDYAV